MVRSAALLLVIAGILAASPAAAQFGSIFGDAPPRPPADIPDGPFPQQPPPPQYPSQAPPPYPSQAAPAYPAAPAPTAIEAEPLPPPPGAVVAPGMRQAPGLPQRPLPPPQPALATPPGNPSSSPAPAAAAAAAPPPDNVVIERPTAHIANGRADFAGLDKITGRTFSFDAAIGETVQFGALRVTPRACYTRPPTEASDTDAFVEVDEVTLNREVKRIFTGWMFASSPGLNAVEHPIYDVWLTDCGLPVETSLAEPAAQPAPTPARTRHPVRPRARSSPDDQPPPR